MIVNPEFLDRNQTLFFEPVLPCATTGGRIKASDILSAYEIIILPIRKTKENDRWRTKIS
jgi:hypothetical protein